MDPIHALRKHLVKLLEGKEAHAPLEQAIEGVPVKLRGVKPEGAPHSAWELSEHIRIAQWDILEFTRNPKHESPSWPEGYWPTSSAPPNSHAWDQSVKQILTDLKAMQDLVADPKTDLFAPVPSGTWQTTLREAMLLADHNAYHGGELVFLRRLLGAWK